MINSINEFEQIFDEVYPHQINLKSFEKKDILCPSIWQNADLKKIIRQHLKNIAMDFIEDFEMNLIPYDIVLVGSIAGYNWSKYSDIDLHIILDFSRYEEQGSRETLKKLFDAYKNDWNLKNNILIYGYPVEIYSHGKDEVNASDGIYSIMEGKWIKVPQGGNAVMNKELIKKQASQYINHIDRLEELAKSCTSKKLALAIKNKAKKYKDEISQGRKDSLGSGQGEYGSGNIVFKVLRRSGHIGKLNDIKIMMNDKINSL